MKIKATYVVRNLLCINFKEKIREEGNLCFVLKKIYVLNLFHTSHNDWRNSSINSQYKNVYKDYNFGLKDPLLRKKKKKNKEVYRVKKNTS